MASDTDFFPYRFDPRYRLIWRPIGAREGRDGVTLSADSFVATYGRQRVETPLSNVSGAHVTTGYQWWKAVGIRLSFADDGLTFGTATHGGVCVHFAERVRRVVGVRRLSGLSEERGQADGSTRENSHHSRRGTSRESRTEHRGESIRAVSRDHSAVTVTVEDLDGLVAAIEARVGR